VAPALPCARGAVVSGTGERQPGMDRSEIAPLTGLRAFAALAVVLYNHRMLIHSALPGLPDSVGSQGYLGVDVFFVLSGFVLALNYGGRIHSGRDYFEFVGYRVARL